MGEEKKLCYVRWEECTKRDQELMVIKTDPVWKADSNGVIKAGKVHDTDLKLRYALQRRALAFDQSRLVDFAVYEEPYPALCLRSAAA